MRTPGFTDDACCAQAPHRDGLVVNERSAGESRIQPSSLHDKAALGFRIPQVRVPEILTQSFPDILAHRVPEILAGLS